MLYLIAQNLGLWHVTQRYDRDTFVRVDSSNIIASHHGDLAKLNRLLNTHGMPYDFASLMHFPAKVNLSLFDNAFWLHFSKTLSVHLVFSYFLRRVCFVQKR